MHRNSEERLVPFAVASVDVRGEDVVLRHCSWGALVKHHFCRFDNSSTPGRFVSGIAVDPGNPDHA